MATGRGIAVLMGVALAGVVLAAGPGGADDHGTCPADDLRRFSELAPMLAGVEARDPVLSVDLIRTETPPCEAVWLVEILDGDEIVLLGFDGRTLAPWPRERLDALAARLEGEEEDEDDDLFPVSARLNGGAGADELEGFWSDDVMTGGPGPDVFIASPGSDVITDFDPAQDLLVLADFLAEERPGAIPDLAALRRAIRAVDGGLVIDLDGRAGDWSLRLDGVAPDDLIAQSVRLGEEDGREIEAETFPSVEITMSDDSIVTFPPHPRWMFPVPGTLVEGDPRAVEMLHDALFDMVEDRVHAIERGAYALGREDEAEGRPDRFEDD